MQYVAREEQRESFKQSPWQRRELPGDRPHVTYAKMDVYLAKLEAGEDAETPECHDRPGCDVAIAFILRLLKSIECIWDGLLRASSRVLDTPAIPLL